MRHLFRKRLNNLLSGKRLIPSLLPRLRAYWVTLAAVTAVARVSWVTLAPVTAVAWALT
jgi:hypothetical protein